MLKIAIKLSALLKEDQINEKQRIVYNMFQKKLRAVILTVISFTSVDYSYDRNFITNQMESLRELLSAVVEIILSEKSLKKVDRIFDILTDTRLLDEMFIKKGEFHQELVQIVRCLETIMDEKS